MQNQSKNNNYKNYYFIKTLLFFVLINLTEIQVLIAQPPNIYYASPQNYFIGNAITPLSPTNSGGAVPPSNYGQVNTYATSISANLDHPNGVAVDLAGNLYIANFFWNNIPKITFSGNVSILAGTASNFNNPMDVAVDASGNVYVADTYNNKIRKITLAGIVTTLAGSGIVGATDGIGTAASFNTPQGLAIDSSGNVYVADSFNNKIRKITVAGVVTTLAGSGIDGAADGVGSSASFGGPTDVAVDGSGNVYVADDFNHKIRKITPAGLVSTFAGNNTAGAADGIGTAASFNFPHYLAVDNFGNVYVSDSGNNKIRKISSTGEVTTLAGTGTAGSVDGPGTIASFNVPRGVAVDAVGNVYIADSSNNKIRKISQLGYSISPNLPSGLIFDNTTGTISGTPTVNTTATNYAITACNDAGCSTTILNISTSVLGTTIFNKASIVIYPNPTSTKLNLQFPNEGKADKITITDLTGKIILTQTTNTTLVNVESLANGMYIIEAYSREDKFITKFIKE